jgi:hypothetical protein
MSVFRKLENPVFDTYVSMDGANQLITIMQQGADDKGVARDIDDEPAVVMMTREGFASLLEVVREYITEDGDFVSMEIPYGLN